MVQMPRRGTTDIHIRQAQGEFLRLFVNHKLVAEIFAGDAQTDTDWPQRLRQARTLAALPRILKAFAQRISKVHNREDHVNTSPKKKVVAFVLGFADGLLGIEDEHPANHDFSGLKMMMQRDYSPCFSEGFETGACIKNIVQSAERGDEDRTKTIMP